MADRHVQVRGLRDALRPGLLDVDVRVRLDVRLRLDVLVRLRLGLVPGNNRRRRLLLTALRALVLECVHVDLVLAAVASCEAGCCRGRAMWRCRSPPSSRSGRRSGRCRTASSCSTTPARGCPVFVVFEGLTPVELSLVVGVELDVPACFRSCWEDAGWAACVLCWAGCAGWVVGLLTGYRPRCRRRSRGRCPQGPCR